MTYEKKITGSMKQNPKQFFKYLNSKCKIKCGVSELKDKKGNLCYDVQRVQIKFIQNFLKVGVIIHILLMLLLNYLENVMKVAYFQMYGRQLKSPLCIKKFRNVKPKNLKKLSKNEV